VAALADDTDARVRTYGLSAGADISAADVETTPDGQRFTLTMGGLERGEMMLPMHGRHNLQNALAVALIALTEGCSPEQIAEGFRTFEGMKRRQEVRGTAGGVTVIDDFAHHPTAVASTIDAVQTRFPDRRVVAVFEPRSNSSRRKVFEDDYAQAFDAAGAAFLKAPPVRHNDDADAMLDPEAVTGRIAERGVPATAFAETDDLLPALVDTLRPGDVALVMSNGGFDNLHTRLLDALDDASGSAA
jgi:UDP-N-acetylmuramate: L-alanyl-gamma-D-glutamyl-meso-diaminopimelate ligase